MRVYDIVNAGPRHRFLVRTRKGQPLLVSNCTQATAADFMAHGAITAEQRGMEPFMLVHDQALALRRPGKTPEDFEAALGDLPPWAVGMPLKVEAKQCPYYKK